MVYILLIFYCTTKIFNFQIFLSLKKIIMIIKNYHIIKIYITQVIDSTLNPDIYFLILM